VSLTGHLDVFPLEEILRLLARTHKSGCLRVDSPDLQGRVFLNDGSLALATVSSDEDLRRQLIGSKLVTEEAVQSAERTGRSLNDVASDSVVDGALATFFKEEVVENLYRIRRPGRGQFVFNVDVAPRFRADAALDVELCIAEADRRAADWADVESVIPSIEMRLTMTPEAPNGQPVTLSPGAWRVVAAFQGSDTIRALADRLGISRFSVARDLSALVRGNLVSVAGEATGPTEERKVNRPDEDSVPQGPDYDPFTSPPPPLGTVLEPISATAQRIRTPAPPESYNQGWWTEPVAEASTIDPGVSRAEPQTSDEHFLERVFSQLAENPEGVGVDLDANGEPLKRHRMTSISADD
jgi:hypothetical protein